MGSTIDNRDLPANSARARQQPTNEAQLGADHEQPPTAGLSTRRALIQLRDDIELEIAGMDEEISRRKFTFWLFESISFKSELSKMRWPSVLFMTGQAVAHFIVAFLLEVDNLATNWVGFQGFVLMSLLLLNLSVNLWDTKLRFQELIMKSKRMAQLIDQCSRDRHLLRHWRQLSWRSARAKDLFAPKSPCVHQTLTYRDKSCFNLPDYLLVKGDVIHLFPGDRAPSDCISLACKNSSDASEISLRAGEIFFCIHGEADAASANLNSEQGPDPRPDESRKRVKQFSHAKLKRANEGENFLVLSTPYISSLRISLQGSLRRPVNSIEKECFIVSRKYFETFVVPSVFVLSTIVTAVHYGYLDLTDSDQKIKTSSIAHLLLRPSLTIMPFLPWMFPCFWLAVNAYGSARLLCIGESQRRRLARTNSIGQNRKFENLLATPTVDEVCSGNKHDEDGLHDLAGDIDFKSISRVFLDLVWGRGGHIWRSSNLLQALGCLTSLCCIDKIGILSWPNPTPEKVFTLTGSDSTESHIGIAKSYFDDSLQVDLQDDAHVGASEQVSSSQQESSTRTSFIAAKPPSGGHTKAEILDVSQSAGCYHPSGHESIHSQHQGGRLQFDDPNWHKFINNLKPLGLAIMMNNCCVRSFGDYFRFYKHISCESIERCNLTPVVERRCICALSRMIGFSGEAVGNYRYVNQIGVYKLNDPSTIKGGKLVSNFESTSRLKLPFSNMICNIQQDVTTGSNQVFSQGSADIILDASVEYWDGRRLVPLDESAKKKMIDFYHRSSLTSYCSAFAYTPLLRGHELSNHYIELPPGNSKLAPHLRRLASEQQEEFLENQLISLPRRQHRHISQEKPMHPPDKISNLSNKVLRRHLSTENLYAASLNNGEAPSQAFNGSKKQVAKLNDTLDELTDQVFVGMVAVQYQACPDFVALVEQLEHACIRFVHFSEENELRSRVFSEKMGLESGWNCHISLQGDKDLVKVNNRLSISDRRTARDEPLGYKFTPSSRIETILTASTGNDEDFTSVSSDDCSLYSWRSLPSLVMQIMANLSSNSKRIDNQPACGKSNRLAHLAPKDNLVPESDHEVRDDCAPSVGASSIKDEHFNNLTFDMSNRAKLPKGIENIRPHLETVDNVPLQVSLFTDCTPELTKEMIEIMQDYGEIVCVIGSSSSPVNTSIFLQANVGIAIEPLMPQTCTRSNERSIRRKVRECFRRRRHVGKSQKNVEDDTDNDEQCIIDMKPIRLNNPRDRLGIGPNQPSTNRTRRPSLSSSSSSSPSSSSSSSSSGGSSPEQSESNQSEDDSAQDSLFRELPTPSALASRLASLPCAYNYNRIEPVNLHSLIMEARHFTFKMRNTFVCMICFALSISSAQFLASLLFLPPMLSSGLTIWLTVVVVPLMSFSLMSTTMDSQVMKIAVGKNLQLKPENITFFVVCYLVKFIPAIIVVVLSFGLIIAHSCKLTGFGSSSLGPCWMFTYVQHGNATSPDQSDQDLLWSGHLLTAQVCAAFLLVLYFVVISAGFVHRSHLMWERSPTRNGVWVLTSLALVFGQLIYNQLVLQINLNSSSIPYDLLASLPAHIWAISFLNLMLVFAINLLVKRAEIKATTRQQRRARFDFNTKLGMNSPF